MCGGPVDVGADVVESVHLSECTGQSCVVLGVLKAGLDQYARCADLGGVPGEGLQAASPDGSLAEPSTRQRPHEDVSLRNGLTADELPDEPIAVP